MRYIDLAVAFEGISHEISGIRKDIRDFIYRIHTTPEGIVTKVEREKKTKSKVVWEELKI